MTEGGVLTHNLHAGSKRLEAELLRVGAAYARVFGDTRVCRLPSLDSKPWAGNAILAGVRESMQEAQEGSGASFGTPTLIPASALPDDASDMLQGSVFERAAIITNAHAARKRWGVGFDLAARCRPVGAVAVQSGAET
eukprot:CAMPEP_0181174476 /NCGR_PEP_ID=MMETSP1096-20121128/3558_1 /TAXON_ID=156174 ORGANISM="Chrysochromulina ericina, Strain CCMP281" /NCGR_SAMPLE_ID=MMETSP1096 /ASSEMBLY_ACC=CAM_ASM_000453 /LENGTH=137 /DNA_ID=CAMNT_0023262383 /DNA_START=203 /DNA_END=619 /DNA_ORIENTATION=+